MYLSCLRFCGTIDTKLNRPVTFYPLTEFANAFNMIVHYVNTRRTCNRSFVDEATEVRQTVNKTAPDTRYFFRRIKRSRPLYTARTGKCKLASGVTFSLFEAEETLVPLS